MNKFCMDQHQLASVLIPAVVLLALFPLAFDIFRLNLVGKVPDLRLRGAGPGHALGLWRRAEPGPGCSSAWAATPWPCSSSWRLPDPSTKISPRPAFPDFMDWNQLTELPLVVAALRVQLLPVRAHCRRRGAGAAGLHHRLYAMFKRRVGGVLRHHHPGGGADPHGAHHRPAGATRAALTA